MKGWGAKVRGEDSGGQKEGQKGSAWIKQIKNGCKGGTNRNREGYWMYFRQDDGRYLQKINILWGSTYLSLCTVK